MSPDPINTNTSFTPPPPEPSSSKDTASTASTTDRSNDALMAALKRTLTRLGIDASTGLTISGNDNADALSLPRRVSASSASLIAALYQALELQQSIALANGLSTQGNGSTDALSAVSDSPSLNSAVSGYRDLGAQIADLAKMSGTVASDDDADTDEWDFGIDDSAHASSAYAESNDPMTAAIGHLNQALQDHVAALAQDAHAKVSLAAVLHGVADETKGVQWRPLGVLIDVQA